MLPTVITSMLDALDQSSSTRRQANDLKGFARTLVHAPDLAGRLVDEIAGISAVSACEEHMSQLLGAALDKARMARENGQRRGTVLIDALEEQLGRLVEANGVSFEAVWRCRAAGFGPG